MSASTSTFKSTRRKKQRIKSSNYPTGIGILVSSILISHPFSSGAGVAAVQAAPSTSSTSSINSRSKRSENIQFHSSIQEEADQRRREKGKGKEKEDHSRGSRDAASSSDSNSQRRNLDDVDLDLPSSINSKSNPIHSDRSGSLLFDYDGTERNSHHPQSLDQNQHHNPSSSSNHLNKRSFNSTNLLLASTTAYAATTVNDLSGGMHRLSVSSGYGSGLASTWTAPERSVWFAKKAIIIISIFLAIFIVLIIGAAVFLRDRKNDALFLGLDDDEDEELAIERMVQERLRKSLKAKNRRRKAWSTITGLLNFKKKGNGSNDGGDLDEKSEADVTSNRAEDDRNGDDRGSGGDRSSSSRENGMRERRPTRTSSGGLTTNNQDGNGTADRLNASSNSSVRNRGTGSMVDQNNSSSSTQMRVTQELKDRERLAQSSMMGKWRLRRRRRAAVGAAALAAEEEEDFKNRVRENLRVRNDSNERINGSDNGLENRRNSSDSLRPSSTRSNSNGRDNRIVNASRWIRVPVIGSSPNSTSRRAPRRSAAAASRIDAPIASQSQINSNLPRSEGVGVNESSNPNEPSNSMDSVRVEGPTNGSGSGSSQSQNQSGGTRLDASDLSAAEHAADSEGIESTALPPAYIASRSNRSNANRINNHLNDDSPSESRRNSLDERIAPPPPHPQHIHFTRPRDGEAQAGPSQNMDGRSGISAAEEKEALRRARAREDGEGNDEDREVSDEIRSALDFIDRNDQLPQDYNDIATAGPSNSSSHHQHGAHVATDDKAVLGALAAGRSAPTQPQAEFTSTSSPQDLEMDLASGSNAPDYAPARPSAPEIVEDDDLAGESLPPPTLQGVESSRDGASAFASGSQSRQVFTSSNEKSRETPLPSSSTQPISNLPEPPRSLNTAFDHTAITRVRSRDDDENNGQVFSPFDQPYQSSWPPNRSQRNDRDPVRTENSGSSSLSPSAPPSQDETVSTPSIPQASSFTSNALESEEDIARLNRRKEKQREAGHLDRHYPEPENDGGSIPLDQDGIPFNLLPNSPNSLLLPSYPSEPNQSASAPPASASRSIPPSAPQVEDDQEQSQTRSDGNTASAPDEADLMLDQLEKEIEEEDRMVEGS